MKKLENSRVLVTGGAGFIGSNLVEALGYNSWTRSKYEVQFDFGF